MGRPRAYREAILNARGAYLFSMLNRYYDLNTTSADPHIGSALSDVSPKMTFARNSRTVYNDVRVKNVLPGLERQKASQGSGII